MTRTAVDVVEDIRALCKRWLRESQMVLELDDIGPGLAASARAQREAAKQVIDLMYGDE